MNFSSQPVVLDTVDMEQVRKLKAFKASCESRGLFETYDSHGEFKDKYLMNRLQPGASFMSEYIIRIEK